MVFRCRVANSSAVDAHDDRLVQRAAGILAPVDRLLGLLGGHRSLSRSCAHSSQRRCAHSTTKPVITAAAEVASMNVIVHQLRARRTRCLRGQPDRIRLGGDEFAAEEEDLEPIEWWRWFQEFDRRNLQLIYDPSKGWFTMGSRLAPSGS